MIIVLTVRQCKAHLFVGADFVINANIFSENVF